MRNLTWKAFIWKFFGFYFNRPFKKNGPIRILKRVYMYNNGKPYTGLFVESETLSEEQFLEMIKEKGYMPGEQFDMEDLTVKGNLRELVTSSFNDSVAFIKPQKYKLNPIHIFDEVQRSAILPSST